MMPYLSSLGLEISQASIVAMVVPLSSLIVRIPYGLLTDVFKKKYILALAIALKGIGLLIFWLMDGSSFWLILLFAIIFGFGVGGFLPTRPPILREYFGTKNFGVIFGLTSVFITIGTIVAPPLAGLAFDTLGTYKPAWLVLSLLSIVGAGIILATPSAPGKPAKAGNL